LDLLDAGGLEDGLKTRGNGDIGKIGQRETDPDGVAE